MLKLRVAQEQEEGDVKEFRLVETEDGGITLEETEDGWSVISLNIVDGKINLTRHNSIDDEAYNLNEDGQIEEVDE